MCHGPIGQGSITTLPDRFYLQPSQWRTISNLDGMGWMGQIRRPGSPAQGGISNEAEGNPSHAIPEAPLMSYNKKKKFMPSLHPSVCSLLLLAGNVTSKRSPILWCAGPSPPSALGCILRHRAEIHARLFLSLLIPLPSAAGLGAGTRMGRETRGRVLRCGSRTY